MGFVAEMLLQCREGRTVISAGAAGAAAWTCAGQRKWCQFYNTAETISGGCELKCESKPKMSSAVSNIG